jgi:hypothetical protein
MAVSLSVGGAPSDQLHQRMSGVADLLLLAEAIAANGINHWGAYQLIKADRQWPFGGA